MTPIRDSTLRRVLVALDASEAGISALEAAAKLASHRQIELQAVFVEDESLLRLAALPFAREVAFSSASPRPLNLLEMERMLRAKASTIQKTLADRALADRIRFSFQVIRGPLVLATLQTAGSPDVLFLGRETPSSAPIRSTRRNRRNRPFVVVCDDEQGARRALDVLTLLEETSTDEVVIVMPSSNRRQLPDLRAVLSRGRNRVSVHLVPQLDFETIAKIANDHDARLVLMNQEASLSRGQDLELLVVQLRCPLGLVRRLADD